MKYTIEGFSQAILVQKNLDPTDALILRWFVDFQPKMKKLLIENEIYSWVNYQAIIDDLPILGITNREVVARRFNKLIKAGFVKKYISKIHGVYTYFCLTPEYLNLLDSGVDTMSTDRWEGADTSVEGAIDSPVDTNNSSIIINSSIKSNKNIKKENDEKVNIKKIYEYWNLKTKQNVKTDQTINKNLLVILKSYSLEQICKVIDFISTDPWYIKTGNVLLTVLARPTKFAEKLDRALYSKKEVVHSRHDLSTRDYSIENAERVLGVKVNQIANFADEDAESNNDGDY